MPFYFICNIQKKKIQISNFKIRKFKKKKKRSKTGKTREEKKKKKVILFSFVCIFILFKILKKKFEKTGID